MFYDNFVRLCVKKGKSPSAVALELGINKSAVSNWKRRKNGPSDANIQKIADYFEVSVSELTNESKKISALENESGLDKEDLAILNLILSLPDEKKKEAMNYLHYLASSSEN